METKDWRVFKMQNEDIVGARTKFVDAFHALMQEMFEETQV